MLWSLKYKPQKLTDYLGNKTQQDIASKWIKHISTY